MEEPLIQTINIDNTRQTIDFVNRIIDLLNNNYSVQLFGKGNYIVILQILDNYIVKCISVSEILNRAYKEQLERKNEIFSKEIKEEKKKQYIPNIKITLSNPQNITMGKLPQTMEKKFDKKLFKGTIIS